jgi:endoglucanase
LPIGFRKAINADRKGLNSLLKDIDFIKSAGFDHIRLPVDEEQLWDSTEKREEGAFRLLNDCMTWVHDGGLRIVLDLHIIRSHYFNAQENPLWTKKEEQDKLIRLWKDLSSVVRKWPTSMLAYEFMNEPVAKDNEQWNILLARVADSVRSWEKERTLVIGSNRWQSVSTFDQLRVPPGDKNILLSFHFYEPFYLTHYKASWTDLKNFNGQVQYPGQIVIEGKSEEEQKIYNRDTLEKMMSKAFRLADSLNLPLYCGEFGVIDGAPENAKIVWYRDMVAIFEKHNIAYANWNYKAGSFGIVDAQMTPRTTFVNILTGKNSVH